MMNVEELKAKVTEKTNAIGKWMFDHELETGMILTGASTIACAVLWKSGYNRGVKDCTNIVKAYDLGYQNGLKK